MKKLLFIVGALMLSTSVLAKTLVPLSVSIIDEQPLSHGHLKSPMCPPVVYIEDYTFSFTMEHPNYVLTIKDEYGGVVFTTTVISTENEVVLPSTLSGNYEI